MNFSSLTGSQFLGARVAQQCVASLRKFQLEMGGKNPQPGIAAVFAGAKPSGMLAPAKADARRYLAMGTTFAGVGSDLGTFRMATQALCDHCRD